MARAKKTPEIIRAEVLLRNPDPVAFERVAGLLRQKGVEVTARGAASLSIRCSRRAFEQLFGTQLIEKEREAAGQGVRDFGPLKHNEYEMEPPATVPSDLASDVQGIYLQGPARLF